MVTGHQHLLRARRSPLLVSDLQVRNNGSTINVADNNLAVDIACETSPQTDECHLVTRTGGWIIPRFVLGMPVEAWDSMLESLFCR